MRIKWKYGVWEDTRLHILCWDVVLAKNDTNITYMYKRDGQLNETCIK